MIECVVEEQQSRDTVSVFFFERENEEGDRHPWLMNGARLVRSGLMVAPHGELPVALVLTTSQAAALWEALQ